MDVFKTTRLDSTWKHWSTPLNIGREVNGVENDYGYKVATEGNIAYFSTNGDIYQVMPLPAAAQPLPVKTAAGVIRGADGNPIGNIEIHLVNLQTNREVGVTHSDPKTGEYYVVLPADSSYGFVIKKPGYVSMHDNVKPFTESENLDTVHLYTIAEIKKGVSIPLNNLFFDTDSHIIKPESFDELDRWAAFIKENNLRIEIEGHTDNAGSSDHNKKLSFNRANAAKEYLINQGISKDTITVSGSGDTKSIASNETEEGKAKNRRVEIRFKTNL